MQVLLIKEFVSKLGIDNLLAKDFSRPTILHYSDIIQIKNLLQMIYMMWATSKMILPMNLQNDPVFKSVLEKTPLHRSLRYQDSLTVWMKMP